MAEKESPTRILLGITGGIGVIGAIVYLFGARYGALFAGYLIYEFWTLFNRYPGDTISELIWTYRKRSVLPLMFGLAVGAGVASGLMGEPAAVGRGLLLGGLLGHFFWPPEEPEPVRVLEVR